MNLAVSLPTREISFISVVTLVVWLATATVGVIGFIVPYARPSPPQKTEVVLEAQTLHVELTTDPLPNTDVAGPARPEPAPLDPVILPQVDMPSLIPVAEPTAVAFALPVEGPVQVVEPRRAAFAAPAVPVETPRVAVAAPPVQQIIYGQGEGRQPAPEYPYRARREGQEGVVKVRFNVAESGEVVFAEASVASPWPLLNEAAVKVVRERWRFRPGPARYYEVAIRFQLSR